LWLNAATRKTESLYGRRGPGAGNAKRRGKKVLEPEKKPNEGDSSTEVNRGGRDKKWEGVVSLARKVEGRKKKPVHVTREALMTEGRERPHMGELNQGLKGG